MAQGQRAVSLCGLIIPRSLDQNGLPFVSFTEAGRQAGRKREQPHNTLHRHGAEAARRFTLWAHNSEVTGSKPVAGILQFGCFTEAARHS